MKMKLQLTNSSYKHVAIRVLHRFQNLELDMTGICFVKTGSDKEPVPILEARTGPEREPDVSEPDRNRIPNNFQI